ncbi:hypothetical protein EBS80_01535, partial [bacterium]|nr:hypothetical protein [bacterium]
MDLIPVVVLSARYDGVDDAREGQEPLARPHLDSAESDEVVAGEGRCGEEVAVLAGLPVPGGSVAGIRVLRTGPNRRQGTTHGRDVAVLFGDGAGAAVIGVGEEPRTPEASQIFSTHLHADGRFAKELWVPEPGNAHSGDRLTPDRLKDGGHFPKMNGKTVF